MIRTDSSDKPGVTAASRAAESPGFAASCAKILEVAAAAATAAAGGNADAVGLMTFCQLWSKFMKLSEALFHFDSVSNME